MPQKIQQISNKMEVWALNLTKFLNIVFAFFYFLRYVNDPNFQIDKVKLCSKTTTYLCQWIRKLAGCLDEQNFMNKEIVIEKKDEQIQIHRESIPTEPIVSERGDILPVSENHVFKKKTYRGFSAHT